LETENVVVDPAAVFSGRIFFDNDFCSVNTVRPTDLYVVLMKGV
jgi:hypothetical protein